MEGGGIDKLTKSFDTVIAAMKKKADRLIQQRNESAKLGPYEAAITETLATITENGIVPRIWAHDFTVWKPNPAEISNRLGWLHTVEIMQKVLPNTLEVVDEFREAGFTDALLLGMGGSSLAPQVFMKTFGGREGYLNLSVLDTVDPNSVFAQSKRLQPSKTLYIVSTKSGSTVETLSLMKYFYDQEAFRLGKEATGKQFVAITDPGSPLAQTADRYHFRAKFLSDPSIGGRYSALSYFGLVPAALLGIDLARLLDEALTAMRACDSTAKPTENPAAWLGVILGELAKAGRDKVTLICSPKISSFGDWVEQLIAESTGKEGKGLLPVVGEPVGPPEVYGNDRLFVYMRLEGDTAHDSAVSMLEAAGQPVFRLELHDTYELGRQFFVWEMAVAIAGYVIGINPFDQPNVESAKALARKNVDDYKSRGPLPAATPDLLSGDVLVYGKVQGGSVGEALKNFLNQSEARSYVAIQAYLEPTSETDKVLSALRRRIRDHYKIATTVGYGPRYLHSTGQLHKGDAGRGLFVQITAQDTRDLHIPDDAGSPISSITFSVLKQAEALGDQQALISGGRRFIRFHLANIDRDLSRLNETLVW